MIGKRHRKRVNVLLRIRRQKEDLAVQAFTQVRQEGDAIQARLENLEHSLRRHNEAVREVFASGVASDASIALTQYRFVVDDIGRALARDRSQLAAANVVLDRRREQLTVAMKRRKAVGRLSDRLTVQQRIARHRAEVKEMDDLHVAHAASAGAGHADD